MYSDKTYKGRYKVANPSKYIGDTREVIYRSTWELKFMKYCDHNNSVLEWGSEEIVIPYISPIDNRMHRYFVDFFIKVKQQDGQIKKYLIEIKPSKFVAPPEKPKRKTQHYINEVFTWGVNQAKWKSAREYCKTKGWQFEILTEKELGIDK